MSVTASNFPVASWASSASGIDRLPPLHLERLGFLAAAPRHVEPFVGKSAAHAAEDALPDEIANRPLHHPPGRGGGKKDRLLRAEERLQLRMNLAVELFECFAAVPDHRPRESGQGLLRDLDRAGCEKLVVWNHRENVQRPTPPSQRFGAAGVQRSARWGLYLVVRDSVEPGCSIAARGVCWTERVSPTPTHRVSPPRSQPARMRCLRGNASRGIDTTPDFPWLPYRKSLPIPRSRRIFSGTSTRRRSSPSPSCSSSADSVTAGYELYNARGRRQRAPGRCEIGAGLSAGDRSLSRERSGRERLPAPRRSSSARKRTTRKRTPHCTNSSTNFRNTN